MLIRVNKLLNLFSSVRQNRPSFSKKIIISDDLMETSLASSDKKYIKKTSLRSFIPYAPLVCQALRQGTVYSQNRSKDVNIVKLRSDVYSITNY